MLTLIYHDVVSYRIGFHMTKYPTLVKTIENALKTPLQAFQIYIANSRSYKAPKLEPDDILSARKMLSKSGRYMCIHACLLYNLCGSVDGLSDESYDRKLNNTVTGLTKELDIGVGIGIGVVVHIGTSKDYEVGLKRIIKSLEEVLTTKTLAAKILAKKIGITEDIFIKRRKVILENCAGEKNKIGKNLHELRQIIYGLPKNLRKQVKVCIDTAHAFGAGEWDWGIPSEIKRFYKEFDKILGMEYLEVFHMNDSKVKFGGHADRHENIGNGYIYGSIGTKTKKPRIEGFIEFLKYLRKYEIPAIGEPPGPGLNDWVLIINLTLKTKYPMIYKY